MRDERFVNASVGFDLPRMLPTFRVTMGIPGASSALAVAARYGIPPDVMDRAQTLLPEHAIGREDVLRRIQDEQIAAQMARRAAEDELREATKLRVELEAQRELQRAREYERISKDGRELLAALRRARDEVREAEGRIKQRKPVSRRSVTQGEALDTVAAQVAIGGALSPAVARRAEGPGVMRRAAREDELKPGVRAFVPRLGSSVEVLERPARGQLRVAAGPMKLFVGVHEVQFDEGPAREEKRERDDDRAQRTSSRSECDASGQRRCESRTADASRQQHLRRSRAARRTMPSRWWTRSSIGLYGAESIEWLRAAGHGTGALKAAVRDHLKRSPHVERSRAADPEDGGDAFTVLWLKS